MKKCSTTRRKRFSAGLLAIALLLSLVPIQLALAATEDATARYWQITVQKQDSGNGGIAAGDASVVGSVYGLFSEDGELLDEYKVGPDGTFTTKQYPMGTGCWLQEICASSGYRLSQHMYFLDAYITGEDSGEDVIHKTITVKADVMTGTVHMASHTAKPERPGMYNVPQEGTEFQVYLKSAGSYEAAVAMGDERLYDAGIANSNGDIVWENGTIFSKQLAYGTYILHQVSAWENRILEEDVEITFVDDGQHISYFFSNRYYSAQLRVDQRDSESGLMIVDGFAAFKVLNVDTGKYISYYDKETGETIDEFLTYNGNMALPMELPYGNYQLIETRTPEGYYPNTDPISFSVTSTNYGTLYFDTKSIPLKGQLVIETKGDQFTSVAGKPTDNHGPSFIPVYSEDYIDGVHFDLIAAEDIVTGDGVVHYREGDVVETIRTNGSGAVRSQELYIGKYLLVETGVPDGVIPAGEPLEIEVTNDGKQNVSEIPVEITKEYVSTELTIHKQAYIWETVTDAETGEITHELVLASGAGFTFGLFVGDDYFVAKYGNLLTDGSLVAVLVTDEQGLIHYTEQLPYGQYYIRELETPDDHAYIKDERVYEIDLSAQNTHDNKITATVTSTAVEDAAGDIKYQSKGKDLRLVTWVDSLDYQEVVFNVTAGGQTASVSCTTVYSSIYADGVQLDNAAQVFNKNARYFVTYTIEDIPEGVTTFDVSVTWTDLAGNSHTSATRTITL